MKINSPIGKRVKFKDLDVGQFFRVCAHKDETVFIKTDQQYTTNCVYLNAGFVSQFILHDTEEVIRIKINELSIEDIK